MQTATVHAQYLDFGYQPIPLKPASKLPLVTGWQVKPTVQQWYNAPQDVNIGLRAGDGKAFLDIDEEDHPGTFENVTHWLDGLGYHPGDYPVVQSASGTGRHVYVTFTGRMLGSRRNFVSQFGTGDFRYDYGAFVAAPPSIVDNSTYTLISGDLIHRPQISLADLRALVNVEDDHALADKHPAVMSPKAQAIASGNAEIGPDKRYKSRSEAAGALVLSMIDSGYEYADILLTFNTRPCAGKYTELKKKNSANAERWLTSVYRDMLKYSHHESRVRRQLAELRSLAERAPWQWASDKNILIAHLAIAYNAGKTIYNASVRDLALPAGVSKMTASRSNHRLQKRELVTVEKEHGGLLATKYVLNMDKVLHTLSTLSVGICNELSTEQVEPTFKGERIATHNAFRNGQNRLGQRAGQVYELLFTHPDGMTEQQLTEATGAHIKTIRRALDNLENVYDRKERDELPMANQRDGKWYAVEQDLNLIAAVYNTYTAREEQEERYEQERRDHRKSLELGIIAKDGGANE